MTGFSSTIGHMSTIETEIRVAAHHRHHKTAVQDPGNPVTRLVPDPHRHHTHVQQVAWGLLADDPGESGC